MTLATTQLNRSLAIQSRVIGALLMREVLSRYGRHNIGFLWLFLEPMLFTLGVTALWTAMHATHGTNLPITEFALTGYSTLLLWRNGSNRVVGAVEVNLSLFYHRNVRVIDVILARTILECVGATASMSVLSILFISIGWMQLPLDIFTVIVGWLLLVWFTFALCLVIGGAAVHSELVERVWHIATYLMFPLSGAVFMVDFLPKAAQEFVLWVPMVHGVEMIRHGYFGNAVHTYENPAYIALCNSVLMLIGLALVREAGRRVEPQ